MTRQEKHSYGNTLVQLSSPPVFRVTVAVIDSGVYRNHEDINSSNILAGQNFVLPGVYIASYNICQRCSECHTHGGSDTYMQHVIFAETCRLMSNFCKNGRYTA